MELQNEYTVMFALRMIMKLELACQSTSNTNMVLEKKKDTLLSFDLVNTLKKLFILKVWLKFCFLFDKGDWIWLSIRVDEGGKRWKKRRETHTKVDMFCDRNYFSLEVRRVSYMKQQQKTNIIF